MYNAPLFEGAMAVGYDRMLIDRAGEFVESSQLFDRVLPSPRSVGAQSHQLEDFGYVGGEPVDALQNPSGITETLAFVGAGRVEQTLARLVGGVRTDIAKRHIGYVDR